ncbi:MAG: 50S ribosomal protein L4 [Methanomassiliicoccales archaeon]|nr:MAG: 50S ribosomal protein L4 [Methanomassiliicoccales archaeon]
MAENEEIKKTKKPATAKPKKRRVKKTAKKAPKKTPSKKKKGIKKPKKDVKVNLYSIDGKSKKKIRLPKVFFEEVRTDLIKRAVNASRANRRQPYGPNPMSGMRHAVSTWGKGRGVARVQRFSQGRTGAESPGNIGGRRAHPPTPDRNWSKKINKKERKKARCSALSATKERKLILARGHKFKKSLTMPLVVDNSLEKITTAREAVKTLKKLGVYEDLERAKNGIHIRAGRGKMRGRKYRKPKSLLVVVTDKEKALRGFRNIAGVDVTTPDRLDIELLAPGGMPGRLCLFTEGALKQLERW